MSKSDADVDIRESKKVFRMEVRDLRRHGITREELHLLVDKTFDELAEPPAGSAVWRNGQLWYRRNNWEWISTGAAVRTWEEMLTGTLIPVEYPVAPPGDQQGADA